MYQDASFCGACGTDLRQLEETFQLKLSADIAGFLHEPGNIAHYFALHVGENTVGSGAQNDIVIDLPTISWTHALLICRPRRVLVQDSASTNGTFVNAASVRRATRLHHGDLLRLADTEFAVWLRSDMRAS